MTAVMTSWTIFAISRSAAVLKLTGVALEAAWLSREWVEGARTARRCVVRPNRAREAGDADDTIILAGHEFEQRVPPRPFRTLPWQQ